MHRSFHYRVNIAAWLRAEFDQVESLFWAVGARRSSIIALLAFVLGLASTDIAALGALAYQLKLSLSINNAAFGLIVTIATAVGAITTLPVGVWVDRFARIPLLIGLTVLWSIGMAWSGLAGDYYGLLFAQMLVGAVGIAIGPLIASLTGDLFPPSRRARVFGFIVGGVFLFQWSPCFRRVVLDGAVPLEPGCRQRFVSDDRRWQPDWRVIEWLPV